MIAPAWKNSAEYLNTFAFGQKRMERKNQAGGKRNSFLPTFVFRLSITPYMSFGIRYSYFWGSILGVLQQRIFYKHPLLDGTS